MTEVPCPRCAKPVGVEAEICPHCRVPRDDMEMEEGRALVRKEALRLKRRPKLIAAGAAAAILLVGAWLLRGYATGPLEASWREFQLEVERTRQPGHWLKDQAPEPLTATLAPPAVAVSSFLYTGPSAPAPPEGGETPPGPPPPAEPIPANTAVPMGPAELLVQGLVYDLETKRPVSGVTVLFKKRRGDAKWDTMTDAAGRYQMRFDKTDTEDVAVMIEAPGYRKGLLEDPDSSYRERSAQSRAEIIAETADSDLEAVPLRYKESAQAVELNLVLVPQARKQHAR